MTASTAAARSGGVDGRFPLAAADGSLRPNHSVETIHRMAATRAAIRWSRSAGPSTPRVRGGGIITGGARRATRVAPALRREVMAQETGRLRGGAVGARHRPRHRAARHGLRRIVGNAVPVGRGRVARQPSTARGR